MNYSSILITRVSVARGLSRTFKMLTAKRTKKQIHYQGEGIRIEIFIYTDFHLYN